MTIHMHRATLALGTASFATLKQTIILLNSKYNQLKVKDTCHFITTNNNYYSCGLNPYDVPLAQMVLSNKKVWLRT